MKKLMFSILLTASLGVSFGQLYIGPGAQLVMTGNAQLTVADLDFINDGSFSSGNGTVVFSGNTTNSLKGNNSTTFYNLTVAKAPGQKLTIETNANATNNVTFTSGLLDLIRDLNLGSTGLLMGENENSRIIGPNGGEVIASISMNAPNSLNAGNVGCIITSSANLGLVTIRRGHRPQSGIGMANSINRYFNIQPANNSSLNATLRFHYFDAELNAQSEVVLKLFKSTDGGANWTNQGVNASSTSQNYLEKTGINSFSIWTASSYSPPLPVTGLEFSARRVNASLVKLNWKTIQEINNLGFYIERKKENENAFSSTAFVNSKALNGNSNSPLQYERTDTNSYTGKTYYRLKQVDIDGRFSYSIIRMVTGEVEKTVVLKAWPVPAAGDVNIVVQGIDKNETVQVFDMTGKLVRNIPVTDNLPQKVTRLAAGSYIIKLAGDKNISEKIIVQ